MNNSIMDKVGKLIGILSSAVMMNVCFLICCLPVVTIGPAWCGLLSAIRYNVRGEKWFAGFKAGFKTRFWRSLLIGCGAGVFLFITIMDIQANTLLVMDGQQMQMMPLVMSSLVFAMVSMLLQSLLLQNVYFCTDTGVWMRNGTELIRKAPLQLLLCGVLPFVPVLLALLWLDIFMQFFVAWLAIYFAAAAFGVTLLMKDALIDTLVELRANGTLLDEEGRIVEKDEEE